jgi:RNA polymerase sigma factor (sigma-70 family)
MSEQLDRLPGNQADEDLQDQILGMRTDLLKAAHRMLYRFPNPAWIAEDLVQEATWKAISRIHQFSRDAQLSTWVQAIMRNRVIDFIRAQRASRFDASLDELLETNSKLAEDFCVENRIEEKLVARLDVDRITALLSKLPRPIASAIRLRVLGDLSYQAVADELRLPIGTVKSRISRGVAMLREMHPLLGGCISQAIEHRPECQVVAEPMIEVTHDESSEIDVEDIFGADMSELDE